jgi:hypothetical protein
VLRSSFYKYFVPQFKGSTVYPKCFRSVHLIHHVRRAESTLDRMDPSDVSDPSDWNNTPLSSLYPLDSNLRCLICKDFYTAPVITTCLHTFCSLCIRRSLSAEPICPACRTTNISDNGLRQNKVVADLVENFLAARWTPFNGKLTLDRSCCRLQGISLLQLLLRHLLQHQWMKRREYKKSNRS